MQYEIILILTKVYLVSQKENRINFSNTIQYYLLGSILITLCKISHCAKLSKVRYHSKNLCSSILILVRYTHNVGYSSSTAPKASL